MAEMLLLNPRKRRKAKRKITTAKRKPARRRYAKNPVATRRRRVASKVRTASKRRYRRNPIAKRGGILDQMTDAAIAASGAVGLDIVMGAIPLPVALKTGMARQATRAMGAVVLGMVGNAVLPRGTGAKLAQGALTVVFHDAMREQLTTFAPALTLGDSAIPYYPSDMPEPSLGYIQPGETVDASYYGGMGEYVDSGLGEYVESY
jgi:hypothetical protein